MARSRHPAHPTTVSAKPSPTRSCCATHGPPQACRHGAGWNEEPRHPSSLTSTENGRTWIHHGRGQRPRSLATCSTVQSTHWPHQRTSSASSTDSTGRRAPGLAPVMSRRAIPGRTCPQAAYPDTFDLDLVSRVPLGAVAGLAEAGGKFLHRQASLSGMAPYGSS
jgi:hypothetical protein